MGLVANSHVFQCFQVRTPGRRGTEEKYYEGVFCGVGGREEGGESVSKDVVEREREVQNEVKAGIRTSDVSWGGHFARKNKRTIGQKRRRRGRRRIPSMHDASGGGEDAARTGRYWSPGLEVSSSLSEWFILLLSDQVLMFKSFTTLLAVSIFNLPPIIFSP